MARRGGLSGGWRRTGAMPAAWRIDAADLRLLSGGMAALLLRHLAGDAPAAPSSGSLSLQR